MTKKFIISALALVFSAALLSAQGQQMPTIPNDPAVRIGKLDNGLTYYIRHNELPKERAEFYLATNTGGIYETPDQDGLAHFLEHMCFNGTEHFPGKGILNYLQSIGAEFGRNVNASTGFEETQYMLNNIPVARESVVDSCLMIMCDYSHYVTNATEEIDLERPVIREERRQRRNASWRTLENSLPYYFGDTKYATCTLIGSEENIMGFEPQSLYNFYSSWYYPANQAIIVVGDVDVDRTEAKIKEIFGKVPAKENPQTRPEIPFPANAEPVYGILTDPELTSPSIEMVWKSEAMPEQLNNTAMGVLQDIIKEVISDIMYERFNDITSKPGASFLSGSYGFGDVIYETVEGEMANVSLKEDNILGGFKDFYTEVERMRRFGFTDDEFGRAKTNILNNLQNAIERADTRKNPEFVRSILQNFFDNEPIFTPQDRYDLYNGILGQINATALNQILPQLMTGENLVVLYNGPAKEGIQTPTADQIKAVIAEVQAADIQPLASEEIASEFLDASKLKAGKVKATGGYEYGATRWQLKNGIEVFILPTNYAKDQILFDLWREGGSSLIPTEDLASFDSNIWQMFLQNCGVAGFSGTQTTKMLTGKSVSVNPYINGLNNGISGRSTRKDLETALQLVYLQYTQPRFDPEEYQVGIDQIRSFLPNYLNTPEFKMQSDLQKTIYGNNPRRQTISMETLDKASIETVKKNYLKLFGGSAGLNMMIVGDVDLDQLKPLVEKYIGSIPKSKGKDKPSWIDTNEDFVKGIVEVRDPIKMETPLNTTVLLYTAPMEYNAANRAALSAISYIMDMRYTTTLREEIGGTYGASTAAQVNDLPKQEGIFQVVFQSKPELSDTLLLTAKKIVGEFAAEGPTDEEFNMAKLNLQKNIPESRLNNSYWLSYLKDFRMFPYEMDKAYEEAVNALTATQLKETMAKLLAAGNKIEFFTVPE